MLVRLGYVSICMTLHMTTSKTITYQNYLKMEKSERQEKLFMMVRENLLSLYEILKYNFKNHIHFYRLTSHLIPLATMDGVTFDYIYPFFDLYQKIASFLSFSAIRVDMHADPYIVLNSTNPKVIEKSIASLLHYKKVMDALGVDHPKLVLHVGSSQFGKKQSMIRFCHTFQKLEPSLQKMILLENDDKVYDVEDVLSLCQTLDIPMVLDYHHHLCNNKHIDLEALIPDILKTWKKESLPPKIHFSSPKSNRKKEFRSHHDYIDVRTFISFLETLSKYTSHIDIMLEAKMKDVALFQLVRELKYHTNYLFLDDTTFIVNGGGSHGSKYHKRN